MKTEEENESGKKGIALKKKTGHRFSATRKLFREDLRRLESGLKENLLGLEKGDVSQEKRDDLWRMIKVMKGIARLSGFAPAISLVSEMEALFSGLGGDERKGAVRKTDGLKIDGQKVDQIKCSFETLIGIADAGIEKEILPPGDLKKIPAPSTFLEDNQLPVPGKPETTPIEKNIVQKKDEDAPVPPMRGLFLTELRERAEELTRELLEIEQGNVSALRLETVMRLSHTIKGGARLSELDPVMRIAHVMEDIFDAAQKDRLRLDSGMIDVLLKAVDILLALGEAGAQRAKLGEEEIDRSKSVIEPLKKILSGEFVPKEGQTGVGESKAEKHLETDVSIKKKSDPAVSSSNKKVENNTGRVIKVNAESMDRVIGLSGEMSVETKQMKKLRDTILGNRRKIHLIDKYVNSLKTRWSEYQLKGGECELLDELATKVGQVSKGIENAFEIVEYHDSQMTRLSQKTFHEALSNKMRPFNEGLHGFQRLVRDVSQSLGKKVMLEVVGEDTRVDRDILENLHIPLTHILQNAVDHGIEMPDERENKGKNPTGKIRLEARHQGGMLSISIEDDGYGIDLVQVRKRIVVKQYVSEKMAQEMSDSELFEFLLLPNFSLKDSVTTVSGRGVGMNIVQELIQNTRGKIQISSTPGKGTRLELILPVSLSIISCIIIEVAEQIYAVPISRVSRVVAVPSTGIKTLENRQYIILDKKDYIGLVNARQILELSGEKTTYEEVPVVILGKGRQSYGFAVDRILYETDLVQRPLDPRLGKLKDVSSAAFLIDGTPVLILDTEDLIRSIEKVVMAETLQKVECVQTSSKFSNGKQKSILVVDDSMTVRTIEANLLKEKGYAVDVAVDGAEAWNAVRIGQYDMVITDIDMPRMDGITLVKLIRDDARLSELPVVVVSYKDREEDRVRGMEAGANHYLTKGSFQDNSFVSVVGKLMGNVPGVGAMMESTI